MDQLIEVLQRATSQDQATLQVAEHDLQAWQTAPGFYLALQQVFFRQDVDMNIRFLSIITIKNGVNRYWRKTSPVHAIAAEEKDAIRGNFLLAIHEPVQSLANQNAYALARVARIDFPLEWPSLISDVLSIIRTAAKDQSLTTLINGLASLNQIVKVLCANRMMAPKQHFRQMVPELFTFLANLYVVHAQHWVETLQQQQHQQEQNMHAPMQVSVHALKIIRRLVTYGFEHPDQSVEICEFSRIANSHLRQLLALKQSTPTSYAGDIDELVSKHVKIIGKLYIDFASPDPLAFLLVDESGAILEQYWQVLVTKVDDAIEDDMWAKTVVQGMLLIKWCLKILHQESPPSDIKPEEASRVGKARTVMQTFFTDPRLLEFLELLITKYLRLSSQDLEMWQSEPEEWVLEEESEIWESHTKHCAEKLFMELAQLYKAVVEKCIVHVLETTKDPSSADQIYLKEAVYSALGLEPRSLVNVIDFEELVTSRLKYDITNTNPIYRVIRRRVAILIGQWVDVKYDKTKRSQLYEVLQYLMREDPGNDLVIRITAAENLRICIDEWDFVVADYLPYLPEHVALITQLLESVSLTETKLKLVNLLGVIVERMDRHMGYYAQAIIRLLPPLWSDSASSNLLKSAVLAIMTKLVTSLGPDSVQLHAMVLPLVNHGTDPTHEEFLFLFEEALELWEALLHYTTTSTPDLLALIPRSIECLSLGSEHLKVVLKVINSYLYLEPEMMLREHLSGLLPVLTILLGQLKPQACQMICQTLDIAMRVPSIEVYMDQLVSSGLLPKIVYAVVQRSESTIVITQYLSLLSRISLKQPEIFIQYLEHAGQQDKDRPANFTPNQFILQWVEYFDNIGHPRARKLNALGLVSILCVGRIQDQALLQALVSVCATILSEVKENNGGDLLIYWQPEDEDEDVDNSESPEARRLKSCSQGDPVHSTLLTTFIRDRIERLGQSPFKEYINQYEPQIVEQFNQLVQETAA